MRDVIYFTAVMIVIAALSASITIRVIELERDRASYVVK